MASPLYEQFIKLRNMHGKDSLGHLLAAILHQCVKNPDDGSYRPAMIAALNNPDSMFFVQSAAIEGNPIESFKNLPSISSEGRRWTADKGWTCQVFSDDDFWKAKDADTKIFNRAEVLEMYHSLLRAEKPASSENENDVENWG